MKITKKRIQKEDFDLYLGEIKVTPDMSLPAFLFSKKEALISESIPKKAYPQKNIINI